MNRAQSSLLIVISATLMGLLGLATRPLGELGFNAFQITEMRAEVTAVVLFAIIIIVDRRLLKIDPRDIWMFIGTGICSIVFYNTCYFVAIDMLTMSLACVLVYTAPCFIMLMSAVLFKERITRNKVLALVIAFSGCALSAGVFGGTDVDKPIGVVIGIVGGFGYALYTIFCNYAVRKYHPFTVTAYTFLMTAIALLPFCGMNDIASNISADVSSLWIILILGVVMTAIPFFLYATGLRGIEPGRAAVLSFVEPMVATMAGFIVYGESPGMVGGVGILMIMTSVFILNYEGASDRAKRAADRINENPDNENRDDPYKFSLTGFKGQFIGY